MAEENLKKQTKRGLYWSFFNQLSGTGMHFVIGIFMARLLSPEDYGITALPAIFIAIAGVFAGSGFTDALVRKKDLCEEDLSTAFYYSFIVGILCYCLLYLLSPIIAKFYETPVLEPLMRVTALNFIYSPLNTPQNILLKKKLDFKTPTKVSIVCKLLSGVIGITLAFIGYGVWALVLSSLFSGILELLMNWYVVRWYPKKRWSKDSFHYLWNYGNKIMGAQLLDTAFYNFIPAFIGKYYSPVELGAYNRAENYAKLPSQNITLAIRNVTFPVLSKIQDDDEKLTMSYKQMLCTIAFVVFPMMMMLSALARPLVIIMITSKWESCIILLQIICFSLMWWPIHSLNLNLLLIKGRSDLFLKIEVIKKCVTIAIWAITLPQGLVIFCIGGVVGSIISLVINTYYNGILLKYGFFRQMKDISKIVLTSLFMYILVSFVVYMIHNLYLQLLIGSIIGIFFYLSVSFFFKFPELKDVKFLLSLNHH